MLLYGEFLNLLDEGFIVYNLTSFREDIPRLNLLIPPDSLGKLVDRDFDIAYMQYIMSNDMVFYQFFDIINNLYLGNNVYICVSNMDWCENLNESLFKLIQQRYGYNAYRINCPEDYIDAKHNKNAFKFNPGYGLANLDMDKERYAYLFMQLHPDYINQTGGYL